MTTALDVSFLKLVAVQENVDIDKSINVSAYVHGNSAIANATADALGYNFHSETLTQTTSVQGVGRALFRSRSPRAPVPSSTGGAF